jgi:hypothetical protein
MTNDSGTFSSRFSSELDFERFIAKYDADRVLAMARWVHAPFDSILTASFQIYGRTHVVIPPQITGKDNYPDCVFNCRLDPDGAYVSAILN